MSNGDSSGQTDEQSIFVAPPLDQAASACKPKLPTRWYERPSWWFPLAILLGFSIRLYLSAFTEGTYDVNVWGEHASHVADVGLAEYYRTNIQFNHPPFIGIVFAALWKLCNLTGISFPFALRLPFVFLDFATAWLLGACFSATRWRYLVMACYWLHPLACIFSAYHGNTDSAIAFFLLASILLLSKGYAAASGSVLGASSWIKLPGMLSVPALFLFCKTWRARMCFITALLLVAGSGYLPVAVHDVERQLVFRCGDN